MFAELIAGVDPQKVSKLGIEITSIQQGGLIEAKVPLRFRDTN